MNIETIKEVICDHMSEQGGCPAAFGFDNPSDDECMSVDCNQCRERALNDFLDGVHWDSKITNLTQQLKEATAAVVDMATKVRSLSKKDCYTCGTKPGVCNKCHMFNEWTPNPGCDYEIASATLEKFGGK